MSRDSGAPGRLGSVSASASDGFVSREDEVRELSGCLAEAQGGKGGLVEISDGAGSVGLGCAQSSSVLLSGTALR